MAPSASMLFLSYHQLHRPTTEVGAPVPVPPPPRSREEEEEAARGGGFRMTVRSVLSLALFQRRLTEAVTVEGKTTTVLYERVAGEEVNKATAVAVAKADANKELEGKFDEALRLSCWSS